jgi:hypothetical protein
VFEKLPRENDLDHKFSRLSVRQLKNTTGLQPARDSTKSRTAQQLTSSQPFRRFLEVHNKNHHGQRPNNGCSLAGNRISLLKSNQNQNRHHGIRTLFEDSSKANHGASSRLQVQVVGRQGSAYCTQSQSPAHEVEPSRRAQEEKQNYSGSSGLANDTSGREKQMVVQDCWRNQREERRPGTLLGGRKSTWEIRWRMKTSRERRNFLSHTQAKDENFNPHSQRCWKNLIKERINQGTLYTQWSWPEQQLG